MARYRQKPEIVDARQFTGGEANAYDLVKWLNSKGCDVTWVDNTTVMDIHLQERLSFTVPLNNNVYSAYRGDWIVKKGESFRIFSNKEFGERFEQI